MALPQQVISLHEHEEEVRRYQSEVSALTQQCEELLQQAEAFKDLHAQVTEEHSRALELMNQPSNVNIGPIIDDGNVDSVFERLRMSLDDGLGTLGPSARVVLMRTQKDLAILLRHINDLLKQRQREASQARERCKDLEYSLERVNSLNMTRQADHAKALGNVVEELNQTRQQHADMVRTMLAKQTEADEAYACKLHNLSRKHDEELKVVERKAAEALDSIRSRNTALSIMNESLKVRREQERMIEIES